MDHTLLYCNFLKDGKCELGLHGGFPHTGNCIACINSNENNKEYAEKLFSNYEKSHPPTARKISGCCDSAKNYID
jgi:hypothetical protein